MLATFRFKLYAIACSLHRHAIASIRYGLSYRCNRHMYQRELAFAKRQALESRSSFGQWLAICQSHLPTCH